MAYKQTKQPNLDPYINQGGVVLNDWLGWCLAYVQTAFGSGWAGPNAWDSWVNRTKVKHADRNLPSGVYVPIWFSGYGGLGHTGIYKDGKVWSSPYRHKPYADVLNSIAEVERIYGVTYVGWSEDIAGTRVIEYVPTVTEQEVRQAYRDLLQREADAGGLKTYLNSGFNIARIRAEIQKSPEYAQVQQRIAAQKAAAAAEAARIAAEEAKKKAEKEKAEKAAAEAQAKAQAETEKLNELLAATKETNGIVKQILGIVQAILAKLTGVFK